jgi:hypothetical protein
MKYRKRFAIVELMRETEKKARLEKKVAVLGLQQKGLHTRYYLINERLMRLLMTLCPTAIKLEAFGSGLEPEQEALEVKPTETTDNSEAGPGNSAVHPL